MLLVASRPLDGPTTGRVLVLRTIVTSLLRLGHDVVVAPLGARGREAGRVPVVPDGAAVEVVALPPVRRWVVATGRAARRAELYTFNERLHWDPRLLRDLTLLVDSANIDVIVADGVRTAPYAARLDRPWFTDLDDLLSERYRGWVDAGLDLHQLLGFRAPRHPVARAVMRRIPTRRLLAIEAERMAKAELAVTVSAPGVSLVNPLEAARLEARACRTVATLPMAVEVHACRSWNDGPLPRRMVFAGSLTSFPNLAAVRWWSQELAPALHARGLQAWELVVYGEAPGPLRRELGTPSTRFAGSFDLPSLHLELVATAGCMLNPLTEPLGITTKVIEAAMLGQVVLSTPAGVAGMDVADGREVLLWRTPDELADRLRWVEAARPAELASLAARASAWADAHYSPEVVARSWGRALASIGVASPSPGRLERPPS